MSKLIIGLAGRAGSGKSTCARHLVYRYGAAEVSLAEPLKRLSMDVFGFREEQVFGTQAQKERIDERWGISPRTALIKLGHGARQHLGENVWIQACLKKARELPQQLIVISDVRYPNEAEALTSFYRSAVIKLNCIDAASEVDRDAPSERSVDEITKEHIHTLIEAPRSPYAETLLGMFDYTVRNIFREYHYVA